MYLIPRNSIKSWEVKKKIIPLIIKMLFAAGVRLNME